MGWFWWSVLATLTYSGLGVLFKLVSNRESNPYLLSFLYLASGSLFSLPLLVFRGGIVSPSLTNWFWLLLSIGVYTSATVFSFESFQVTDISTATILTRSTPLWIVIGGSLVFGEVLSGRQLAGSALIIVSILVLGERPRGISFHRGELRALLSGLLFGIGALFDKGLLGFFGLAFYQFLSLFLTSFSIYFFYRREIELRKLFYKKRELLLILLMGFLLAVGNLFLFTAYQSQGFVSLTNLVTQMRIPIIALFGIFFLKERGRIGYKLFATFFILIGTLLLR